MLVAFGAAGGWALRDSANQITRILWNSSEKILRAAYKKLSGARSCNLLRSKLQKSAKSWLSVRKFLHIDSPFAIRYSPNANRNCLSAPLRLMVSANVFTHSFEVL